MLRCGFLVIVAISASPLATAAKNGDSSPLTLYRNGGLANIMLWPRGSVPGERPGIIGNETHAAGDGGNDDQIYSNVTVPTLTPFLVDGATSAVVVAPGGGYSILAFNREGTDIAFWANSVGLSAFVLKYRVPSRAWLSFGEAPLMDAQRALGIVRLRAKEFNLDPKKIGFMGFSAGGHLAAHLATNYAHRAYPRIDAADDLSCKPDFSLLVYPWKVVDSDLRTLLMNITNETPPAFLSQAEDDPVHCENAIEYFLGMKRVKAPASELHVWPTGGHGYGRCTVYPKTWVPACNWADRAATFLRTLLGLAPVKTEIPIAIDARVI